MRSTTLPKNWLVRGEVDVEVGADDGVLRRDRAGQLPFDALLFAVLAVGDGRGHGLGADGRLFLAAGAEEPEPVAEDAAAEGCFVDAVDVVEVIGLAGDAASWTVQLSLRRLSRNEPVNSLPPDLVIVLTTPPVKRPYSAEMRRR